MSGKWFLAILLASCLAAADVLYGAFRKSAEDKSLVTEQMKIQFFNYAENTQHVSKLTLSTGENSVSFVDLNRAQKDTWNFTIHDKTLRVLVPALLIEPAGQPLSPATVAASEKTLQQFMIQWLQVQFQTEKDLLVQVHFQNAPP